MSTQTSTAKPIDRFIPWFFVLFFLVFASVDAFFVTTAIRTNTGVVADDAYEQGLHYNQTLNAAEAQSELGWTSKISYAQNTARIELHDKSGTPITNADIIAKFTRPVLAGHDFELKMKMTAPGIYEVPVTLPLRGQWNLRTFVTWQTKTYQASQLIIAP